MAQRKGLQIPKTVSSNLTRPSSFGLLDQLVDCLPVTQEATGSSPVQTAKMSPDLGVNTRGC